MTEQDVFFEVPSSIDRLSEESNSLEFIYQRKLEALSELKQSFLQKAFSGELTAGKEVSDVIRNKEEVA
ncbi:restriction endonuclease subunit S [Ectothiorhodospira shaposhnikovii]|uniref:restriction endonuclease subunit S n=1 Tax=Ectothiorhodospira shaposhnikovii TaxID=1054 RepID=UPI0039A3B1A9